jgi:tetratricopeptide (TPR) repeat protein
LVALIHRIADAQRAGPLNIGLRARTHELLMHLRRVIRELQDQLSSRGARLCLRLESLDLLVDQARVDEVFLRHGEDFESLGCHLVLSFGLAAEYFPAKRAVSEVFPTLVFPEAPTQGEDESDSLVEAARALLGARMEIDGVFDDSDARIAQVVGASGGRIGWLLEMLRSASAAAGMGVVTEAHVEAAIEGFTSALAGAVPPGGWIRLESVDREQALNETDGWMLTQGTLLPRVQHQRWAVAPSLAADPRFVAMHLTEQGLLEGSVGDLRTAIDILEAARWTGSPEHINALTNLGFTLTDSSSIDETRAIIEKLRNLDARPSIAFLSAQLALNLTNRGQYSEALQPAQAGWEGLRKWDVPTITAKAGYAYMLALAAIGQPEAASEVMSELLSGIDQLPPDHETRKQIESLAARLSNNAEPSEGG